MCFSSSSQDHRGQSVRYSFIIDHIYFLINYLNIYLLNLVHTHVIIYLRTFIAWTGDSFPQPIYFVFPADLTDLVDNTISVLILNFPEII